MKISLFSAGKSVWPLSYSDGKKTKKMPAAMLRVKKGGVRLMTQKAGARLQTLAVTSRAGFPDRAILVPLFKINNRTLIGVAEMVAKAGAKGYGPCFLVVGKGRVGVLALGRRKKT